MKLSRSKSATSNESPLQGRRVLALGQSLASLAKGPLAGASLEMGAMDDLAISASVADLVIIDADAWETPALGGAIKTLSGIKACPPILLGKKRGSPARMASRWTCPS